MAGKCGYLSAVTEIESRIKEKIKFQTEADAKETNMVGTLLLPDLEPRKITEIQKLTVIIYCHKQKKPWKIHILLDGNPAGLYLEPIHLLLCSRILFEYRTLDDGRRVVRARGLKNLPSGRLAQLREDKAPKYLTVSHGGRFYSSSSHIANDMQDLTDILLIKPQLGNVVGSNQVAIAKRQPIRMNQEERADHKSLGYHPPSIIGGRKVAKILASDVQPEIKRWEHAIVGYLIGEDSQDLNVESYVKEQWRDFGTFKTYVLKAGFFLFNFTNGADKSKVLEKGQWFINNRPFILKSWTPNLSLDPCSFLATEIIPICMKNNDTIPDQVVEYEWKPQPCGYCRSLAHISSACALTSHIDAEDSFSRKAPPGSNNGTDDNSATIDDKYISEDSFPTQQSFGMRFNASSLPIEAAINQKTIEELESDEDYCSTACLLNSEEMVAKNWLPYYNKLKDMGLTAKKHFLG